MARKGTKYYVVWQGHEPGIYRSWAECKAATDGYPNARYKSFPTMAAAEAAFDEGPQGHWGGKKKRSKLLPASQREYPSPAEGGPRPGSLCVDASWTGDNELMEYRGVLLDDALELFREGPFKGATNNIGEFLAIVHGLSLLREKEPHTAIYSDSVTALAWVRKRRVKSVYMDRGDASPRIVNLVQRALHWLETHDFENPVLKWETENWGEIPADFDRK